MSSAKNTPLQYPSIVAETFSPHWNLNLSNEQYHADKSAVSSTSLKLLVDKSPKSFAASHNGLMRKETEAFRIGTALHMAILEPEKFKRTFLIMPKFSGKGSVAAKDEWLENTPKDAVILKQDEYYDLEEMIDSVLSHEDAYNILKNGHAEVSGYFRHDETGIKCRIRPDFFHPKTMSFLDVKTTTDIRKEMFQKAIWNFRYDLQMAFYGYGIEKIVGKPVEYHLILAVEKKLPFECSLYLCDDALLKKGREDFEKALGRLKQCLDDNLFPCYQKKLEPISLPEWALKGKKEISNEY